MSSALKQAGFHVPDDANAGDPGLRVIEVPTGALVSWAASNTFTSLTRERAGRAAGDDSLKAIVQAAVSGLLIQLGHTVTETTDSGDLVMLADVVTPPDPDGKDSR